MSNPSSIVGPYIGVTGTPVIRAPVAPDILFVVGAVYSPIIPSVSYYLFGVDIVSGSVVAMTQITGSVNGYAPAYKCNSTYPHSGTQISFNSTSPATSNHLQRSALLLIGDTVYVGFAPYPEINNGWIFGYTFNGTSFSQTAIFSSTPYGTGGGIWGSGAGPASDGTYIYAATGNGTFEPPGGGIPTIPPDIGDSLVKLNSSLVPQDFFAPTDSGMARCNADLDLGSGGALLVPSLLHIHVHGRWLHAMHRWHGRGVLCGH